METRRTRIAVVGAGLNSALLATALVRAGIDDFVVVDQFPFLSRWFNIIQRQGANSMWTAWPYHLEWGVDESLRRFAETQAVADFSGNPSVALFNAHAQGVIQEYHLEQHRLAGVVTNIERGAGGWQLTVTGEQPASIEASRVVIALGIGAPAMPLNGCPPSALVSHVASLDLSALKAHDWQGRSVLVVGRGPSAFVAAKRFAEAAAAVTVVAKGGSLTATNGDCASAWQPPAGRLYQEFARLGSAERRERLRSAWITNTTATGAAWSDLLRHYPINHISTEAGLTHWSTAGGVVRVDSIGNCFHQVVMATGYRWDVAEIGFLRNLLPRLPVVGGLPILNQTLEALPGLHFLGGLSALELGPAALDLTGATYGVGRLRNALLSLV